MKESVKKCKNLISAYINEKNGVKYGMGVRIDGIRGVRVLGRLRKTLMFVYNKLNYIPDRLYE